MRSVFLAVLVLTSGCLKQLALKSLADAIAEPGDTYARDDDPELVRDALPVLMKTMEQLADSLPRHEGLLLALTRAFTSYGVAFVEEEADRVHEKNVDAARPLYARCKRLFLRARGYGLRALDVAAPGIADELARAKDDAARKQALARLKPIDVPLLYWTGAAWGSAIASAKDDMDLVGDAPKVEALERRALELDERFDDGAIHEFFISFEGADKPDQAKQHLDRALQLSQGKKLSPLVSYAETVDVAKQDKKDFQEKLDRVLKFDVDSDLPHRLSNILAQRRAQWLLSRISELFAE